MYTMQHTSLQQHRRDQSSRANDNENDEDLFLFQQMQKREREALNESVALPLHRETPAIARVAEDIFSSSEWDTHDYDWLMTPPVSPFLSGLECVPAVGNGLSLGGSVIVKPTPKAIAKGGSDPASRAEPSAQVARRSFNIHELADLSVTTSSSSVSRKSLSAGTRTRPSTPSRSTTPISRPIARPSTPSKSAASSASVRSSTPTRRAATPSNRLVSSTRPSTPIKRPATPTRVNDPSTASLKSSYVNKISSLPSKSVSSMRPSSPATRARQPATHPAALQGAPQETPPNLRTTVADRPLSNPRGSVALKANATAAVKGTQPQPADVGTPNNRRRSSSPLVTRGRVSSDSLNGGKSLGKPHYAAMISMSNGVGVKMVDKSMPPRKPLPFSQEKIPVVVNTQAKNSVKSAPLRDIKSTSLARESSGFGRNLSKKSLDMALRHMDIRGGTPSGFQSFMSNVPTSSLYSVRTRNSRISSNGRGNLTSSITSSPMATSSTASSEHSMSIVIDPESSELGDETSSEMGSRTSPGSQPGPSMAMSNERKVSCWLGSPGYMDDSSADIMQIFDQELASLSGPESPLVSQPEGIIDCDDFVLDPI